MFSVIFSLKIITTEPFLDISKGYARVVLNVQYGYAINL